MLGTWTKTLEDIPLMPYIENALDWWFKNEKWPPQASDLRERVKIQKRREREAQHNKDLMVYLSRGSNADSGYGLVDYENQKPKPVPEAVLRAPEKPS
jgi:hypothetical protein